MIFLNSHENHIFPIMKSHELLSQALPVDIFESLVEGLVSSGRCRGAFDTFERMKTWATRQKPVKFHGMLDGFEGSSVGFGGFEDGF